MNERDHVIEDFEALKKTIHFLHKYRDEYRVKLKGLVESYNWFARDMPWKLRDVIEELGRDNTHLVVVNFIFSVKE